MKKIVVIGIVIAAVILLGGAGYYFMNKTKSSDTPTQELSMDTTSSNKTSLRSLMGLASNQQCTYKDSDTGSEGTVFVAGDKMRGDFTAVSEGASFGSHMIIIGDDMYVWTDGANEGYKSSLSKTQEAGEQVDQQSQNTSSSPDINKEVNYECNSWVLDNSKFELPEGVNFKDLGAMMEKTQSNIQEEMQGSCEACDNLPTDEARDSCRQAIGC